ncbi:hypothetical protein GWI33_006307 [Rhynchophorus ferrugineus]|uniref:Uncharacterized protein n=1 Tax=Rhynchophorus ferrugineus TaxID=354439 RepID=A0A834IIX1_RHYFE|nr:hypothetical protein GWI33_006307 [Rhynchophorus ferrugineus]
MQKIKVIKSEARGGSSRWNVECADPALVRVQVALCRAALPSPPPEFGNAPWPIVTRLELRTSPVRPGQVGVGPSERSPVEARECRGVDLSPPD